MDSEFQLLSQKIAKLAELAQSLRQENATFRAQIKALTEEKAVLTTKMDETSQRIAHLLEQLPTAFVEEQEEKEEMA